MTALWVTHRLEELAYADAASFMDDGRVQVLALDGSYCVMTLEPPGECWVMVSLSAAPGSLWQCDVLGAK